jgi:hypothetical protein
MLELVPTKLGMQGQIPRRTGTGAQTRRTTQVRPMS